LQNEAAAEAIADGLRSMLQGLIAKRIKVPLVAPMPEQRFRVPACLARRSIEFCSVARSVAEDHRTLALEAVRKATDGLTGVDLWDPLPALCDEKICLAERAGVVMFRDGDHLTYAGSRWLGFRFEQSSAWRALANDTSTTSAASMQIPRQFHPSLGEKGRPTKSKSSKYQLATPPDRLVTLSADYRI
jgi:SGNH domain (fused to AT3 domains)